MFINLLALTLLAGCTAAALLICFAKWGWLTAWEVHRPAWAPELCLFCLGFWLSVVLCAMACVLCHLSIGYVAAALPAAAVCRAVTGPLG